MDSPRGVGSGCGSGLQTCQQVDPRTAEPVPKQYRSWNAKTRPRLITTLPSADRRHQIGREGGGGEHRGSLRMRDGSARGGESHSCFWFRSSLFRRDDVAETIALACLIPDCVMGILTSQMFRFRVRALSNPREATAAGVDRRVCSEARLREEPKLHEGREKGPRACLEEPALRHVTLSDMETNA